MSSDPDGAISKGACIWEACRNKLLTGYPQWSKFNVNKIMVNVVPVGLGVIASHKGKTENYVMIKARTYYDENPHFLMNFMLHIQPVRLVQLRSPKGTLRI